ncbi:MAG: hypothetical protein GY940_30530 [bacterium]|nr:hypothetical protein [bacterium]
MKTCKQVLKEIVVSGTGISAEAKSHQAECETCNAAYKEAAELELYLLSAPELEAPGNLKCKILETAAGKSPRRSFFPALALAFRAVAILIILVAGFWLGLQTANGGKTNPPEDFDIIRDSSYRLNVEPMSPENLGEVYFAVLQEKKNGNEDFQ